MRNNENETLNFNEKYKLFDLTNLGSPAPADVTSIAPPRDIYVDYNIGKMFNLVNDRYSNIITYISANGIDRTPFIYSFLAKWVPPDKPIDELSSQEITQLIQNMDNDIEKFSKEFSKQWTATEILNTEIENIALEFLKNYGAVNVLSPDTAVVVPREEKGPFFQPLYSKDTLVVPPRTDVYKIYQFTDLWGEPLPDTIKTAYDAFQYNLHQAQQLREKLKSENISPELKETIQDVLNEFNSALSQTGLSTLASSNEAYLIDAVNLTVSGFKDAIRNYKKNKAVYFGAIRGIFGEKTYDAARLITSPNNVNIIRNAAKEYINSTINRIDQYPILQKIPYAVGQTTGYICSATIDGGLVGLVGAATGAAIGFATGNVPGAIAGAAKGFELGTKIGSFTSIMASEAGAAYSDYLMRTGDPQRALAASTIYGAVSAAIEQSMGLSPDRILNQFITNTAKDIIKPTLSRVVTRAFVDKLKTAIAEGSEEVLQGAAQYLIGEILGAYKQEDFPVKQLAEEFSFAALGTFFAPFIGASLNHFIPHKVFADVAMRVPKESFNSTEFFSIVENIKPDTPVGLFTYSGLELLGTLKEYNPKNNTVSIFTGKHTYTVSPEDIVYAAVKGHTRAQYNLPELPDLYKNTEIIDKITDFYYQQYKKNPEGFFIAFGRDIVKGLNEENPISKALVQRLAQEENDPSFNFLDNYIPKILTKATKGKTIFSTNFASLNNQLYVKKRKTWYSLLDDKPVTDANLIEKLEDRISEQLLNNVDGFIKTLKNAFRKATEYQEVIIKPQAKRIDFTVPGVSYFLTPEEYSIDNPPSVVEPPDPYKAPEPYSVDLEGKKYWYYYPAWYLQEGKSLKKVTDEETLQKLYPRTKRTIIDINAHIQQNISPGRIVHAYIPEKGFITGEVVKPPSEGTVTVSERNQRGEVVDHSVPVANVLPTRHTSSIALDVLQTNEVKLALQKPARIIIEDKDKYTIIQGRLLSIPRRVTDIVRIVGAIEKPDGTVSNKKQVFDVPWFTIKGIESLTDETVKLGKELPPLLSSIEKEKKSTAIISPEARKIWNKNSAQIVLHNDVVYEGKISSRPPKNADDRVVLTTPQNITIDVPFSDIKGIRFINTNITVGDVSSLPAVEETQQVIQRETIPSATETPEIYRKFAITTINTPTIGELYDEFKKGPYTVSINGNIYDDLQLLSFDANKEEITFTTSDKTPIIVKYNAIDWIVPTVKIKAAQIQEKTSKEVFSKNPSEEITKKAQESIVFQKYASKAQASNDFNPGAIRFPPKEYVRLRNTRIITPLNITLQGSVGIIPLSDITSPDLVDVQRDKDGKITNIKIIPQDMFPEVLRGRVATVSLEDFVRVIDNLGFEALLANVEHTFDGPPIVVNIDDQVVVIGGSLQYNIIRHALLDPQLKEKYLEAVKRLYPEAPIDEIDNPVVVRFIEHDLDNRALVDLALSFNMLYARPVSLSTLAQQIVSSFISKDDLVKNLIDIIGKNRAFETFVDFVENVPELADFINERLGEVNAALFETHLSAAKETVQQQVQQTFKDIPPDDLYHFVKSIFVRLVFGPKFTDVLYKIDTFPVINNNLHYAAWLVLRAPQTRKVFQYLWNYSKKPNLNTVLPTKKTILNTILEDPDLSIAEKNLFYELHLDLIENDIQKFKIDIETYLYTTQSEQVDTQKIQQIVDTAQSWIEDNEWPTGSQIKEWLTALEKKENKRNIPYVIANLLNYPQNPIAQYLLLRVLEAYPKYNSALRIKLSQLAEEIAQTGNLKTHVRLHLEKYIPSSSSSVSYFIPIQQPDEKFSLPPINERPNIYQVIKWFGISIQEALTAKYEEVAYWDPAKQTIYVTPRFSTLVESRKETVLLHELIHALDNVYESTFSRRGPFYAGNLSVYIKEALEKYQIKISTPAIYYRLADGTEIVIKGHQDIIKNADKLSDQQIFDLTIELRQLQAKVEGYKMSPAEKFANAFVEYYFDNENFRSKHPDLAKAIDGLVEKTVLKVLFELPKKPIPPGALNKYIRTLNIPKPKTTIYTPLATTIVEKSDLTDLTSHKSLTITDLLTKIPTPESTIEEWRAVGRLLDVVRSLDDDRLKRVEKSLEELIMSARQHFIQDLQRYDELTALDVRTQTVNYLYWDNIINHLLMTISDRVLPEFRELCTAFREVPLNQIIEKLLITEPRRASKEFANIPVDYNGITVPYNAAQALNLIETMNYKVKLVYKTKAPAILMGRGITINLDFLRRQKLDLVPEHVKPEEEKEEFIKTINSLEFIAYYALGVKLFGATKEKSPQFNQHFINQLNEKLLGTKIDTDKPLCFALFLSNVRLLRKYAPSTVFEIAKDVCKILDTRQPDFLPIEEIDPAGFYIVDEEFRPVQQVPKDLWSALDNYFKYQELSHEEFLEYKEKSKEALNILLKSSFYSSNQKALTKTFKGSEILKHFGSLESQPFSTSHLDQYIPAPMRDIIAQKTFKITYNEQEKKWVTTYKGRTVILPPEFQLADPSLKEITLSGIRKYSSSKKALDNKGPQEEMLVNFKNEAIVGSPEVIKYFKKFKDLSEWSRKGETITAASGIKQIGIDKYTERIEEIVKDPTNKEAIKKLPIHEFEDFYYIWVKLKEYPTEDFVNAMSNIINNKIDELYKILHKELKVPFKYKEHNLTLDEAKKEMVATALSPRASIEKTRTKMGIAFKKDKVAISEINLRQAIVSSYEKTEYAYINGILINNTRWASTLLKVTKKHSRFTFYVMGPHAALEFSDLPLSIVMHVTPDQWQDIISGKKQELIDEILEDFRNSGLSEYHIYITSDFNVYFDLFDKVTKKISERRLLNVNNLNNIKFFDSRKIPLRGELLGRVKDIDSATLPFTKEEFNEILKNYSDYYLVNLLMLPQTYSVAGNRYTIRQTNRNKYALIAPDTKVQAFIPPPPYIVMVMKDMDVEEASIGKFRSLLSRFIAYRVEERYSVKKQKIPVKDIEKIKTEKPTQIDYKGELSRLYKYVQNKVNTHKDLVYIWALKQIFKVQRVYSNQDYLWIEAHDHIFTTHPEYLVINRKKASEDVLNKFPITEETLRLGLGRYEAFEKNSNYIKTLTHIQDYTVKLISKHFEIQSVRLTAGDVVTITTKKGEVFEAQVVRVRTTSSNEQELVYYPISQEVSMDIKEEVLSSAQEESDSSFETTKPSYKIFTKEELDILNRYFTEDEMSTLYTTVGKILCANEEDIETTVRLFTSNNTSDEKLASALNSMFFVVVSSPFTFKHKIPQAEFLNLLKILKTQFSFVTPTNEPIFQAVVAEVIGNAVMIKDVINDKGYVFDINNVLIQTHIFQGSPAEVGQQSLNKIVKFLKKHIGEIMLFSTEKEVERWKESNKTVLHAVIKTHDGYCVIKKVESSEQETTTTEIPAIMPIETKPAKITKVSTLIDTVFRLFNSPLNAIKTLPEGIREVGLDIYRILFNHETQLDIIESYTHRTQKLRNRLKSLKAKFENLEKTDPLYSKKIVQLGQYMLQLEEQIIQQTADAGASNVIDVTKLVDNTASLIQKELGQEYWEYFDFWWNEVRNYGKQVIFDLIRASFGVPPPPNAQEILQQRNIPKGTSVVWIYDAVKGETVPLTQDDVVTRYGRHPAAYVSHVANIGRVIVLGFDITTGMFIPIFHAPTMKAAETYINHLKAGFKDNNMVPENLRRAFEFEKFYVGEMMAKTVQFNKLDVVNIERLDWTGINEIYQPQEFKFTDSTNKSWHFSAGDRIKYKDRETGVIRTGIIGGVKLETNEILLYESVADVNARTTTTEELGKLYETGEIINLPLFLQKATGTAPPALTLIQIDPIKLAELYISTTYQYYRRFVTISALKPKITILNKMLESNQIDKGTYSFLINYIDYVLFGYRMSNPELKVYSFLRKMGINITPFTLRHFIGMIINLQYMTKLVAGNLGFMVINMLQTIYNFIEGNPNVLLPVLIDFIKNGHISGFLKQTHPWMNFAKRVGYYSPVDLRYLRELYEPIERETNFNKLMKKLGIILEISEFCNGIVTLAQFYVAYQYAHGVPLHEALEQIRTGENLNEDALIYATEKLATYQGGRFRTADPAFFHKGPSIRLAAVFRRWPVLFLSGMIARMLHPENFIITPPGITPTKAKKLLYRMNILSRLLLITLLMGGIEALALSLFFVPGTTRERWRRQIKKYIKSSIDSQLLANIITYGVGAAFNLNMSARVSVFNIYSLDPERFDKLVLGVVYSDLVSILNNVVDVLKHLGSERPTELPKGIYAAYKVISPMFFNPQLAINIYTALSYLFNKTTVPELLYYSRHLRRVRVNPFQFAFNTLGISTINVTEELERIASYYDVNEERNDARNTILDRFVKMFKEKDQSQQQKYLQDAIKVAIEHNYNNPAYAITWGDLFELWNQAFKYHTVKAFGLSNMEEQFINSPSRLFREIASIVNKTNNTGSEIEKLKEYKSMFERLNNYVITHVDGSKKSLLRIAEEKLYVNPETKSYFMPGQKFEKGLIEGLRIHIETQTKKLIKQ